MPALCKICATESPLHGVVDIAKSCESARARYFPLRGVPVWYHRCPECGFLFTRDFDHWTRDDWKRRVYNDLYQKVDPDYADGSRARINAGLVADAAGQLQTLRVLDYGGGNGDLARILRAADFEADSWDPLMDWALPAGNYHLVTSFEVFEHTPTPIETALEALSFLSPTGTLLFSTLTCDSLPEQACDWFYLAPANGHISIHSTTSLDRLFGDLGWSVRHLSPHMHVASKHDDPKKNR